MFTLDTNTIIYYLKEDKNAVSVLENIFNGFSPVYISAITEVELFSFPNLGTKEINQIEELLGTLSIISLDSRIARIAGKIRSQYKVGIADSIIAATAMFTGATLLTRNVKDFNKISDISLFKI